GDRKSRPYPQHKQCCCHTHLSHDSSPCYKVKIKKPSDLALWVQRIEVSGLLGKASAGIGSCRGEDKPRCFDINELIGTWRLLLNFSDLVQNDSSARDKVWPAKLNSCFQHGVVTSSRS